MTWQYDTLDPDADVDDMVEIIGFSLKPPKALRRKLTVKAIKQSLQSVDWHKVGQIAKDIGPLVVSSFPGAGPALMVGMSLVKGMEGGDKKALETVAKMAERAAAGDPDAARALQAIDAAKAVHDHVKAGDLQAAHGSIEDLYKI